MRTPLRSFRAAAGFNAMKTRLLDDFDRKILDRIQADARQPADRLAEAVGLSASAVQRRLQRLRETGVIEKEIAVVDAKAVGRPLTLMVELSIERERPEHLDELRRWIANEPAIQQAWYVTGEADLTLVVTARDMEDYDALMQRLVAGHRNVRKFKTSVALAVIKRGLTVPVE
jgi:DNA-binding Lrp family transcriptional regulator